MFVVLAFAVGACRVPDEARDVAVGATSGTTTAAPPTVTSTDTIIATPSTSPPPPTGATAAPSATPATARIGSSATAAASGTTASWPTATGNVQVTSTITVTGTFDGSMKRYAGIGDGSQNENQDPIFVVPDGGTIQNVIIGTPAGDGIHCKGTCTIKNVWWEDVGEDAATFKGTSASQTMTIDGGGARNATDKTFQHNGPGTMIIQNFQIENFGKLYRSCGNCSTQHKRNVIIRNVTVTAPGKTLVGINTNYGDTAQLSGITIIGDPNKKIRICDRFTGNSSGDEPTKTGSGPDGTYCRYTASDIAYR